MLDEIVELGGVITRCKQEVEFIENRAVLRQADEARLRELRSQLASARRKMTLLKQSTPKLPGF